MNRHPLLRGLYAITDTGLCGDRLVWMVEQALLGGARIIQYRDKSDDHPRRRSEAAALARSCRNSGSLLLINDDVELALAVAADGVHLGQDDPDIALARARLGSGAIIGISCYNRFELAEQAQQAGADYVAFGRFHTSRTKPGAVPAGLELLQRARSELSVPAVAIGGITPENGASLIAAGADMLAVVHGIFAQPDIRAACERFTSLFATMEDALP